MNGFLKRLMRTVFAHGTALLLAAGVLAGTAWADALADARAAGYVGERPDGYVQVIDNSAPSSVQALVNEINAQRRAYYQDIANQYGISLEQAGIRGAELLYPRLPPGTPVMLQNGQWSRK